MSHTRIRSRFTAWTAGFGLVGVLLLAPFLAASAQASSTAATSGNALVEAVNALRQRPAINRDAVAPNGYANETAYALAVRFKGSGHPCAATPLATPPGSPTLEQPVCVKISTGSNEVGRAISSFELHNGTNTLISASYNVAGAAVYTSGSHAYVVVDMLAYSTLPSGYLGFGTPTITGKPAVGTMLTVHYSPAVPDDGTVTGVHYSVTWWAGSSSVGTGATYTPGTSDVTKVIHAAVTVTKTGFTTTTVASANTKPVALGTFTFGSTARNLVQAPGDSLEPNLPLASHPAALSFQWYRDSTKLTTQTNEAYEPSMSDLGHTLKVTVTYEAAGYNSVTLTFKGKFEGFA